MKWQDSLRIRISELKSVNIRFNFDRLFVSTLGSQLYCEKKVEYDIEFQPESTDIQIEGTAIHDAIIPTIPLSTDILIETIETSEKSVAIFPVFMKYKGIVISGIHDGVLFINGKVKYLIEIKTTKNPRNMNKIWPGEELQAIVYFFAMRQMGFDMSTAKIIIPKVCQSIKKESYIKEIIDFLEFNKEFPPTISEKIVIHKIELTSKKENTYYETMDNLIKYWTNNREANYSDNINKCKFCDYKTKCSYFTEL